MSKARSVMFPTPLTYLSGDTNSFEPHRSPGDDNLEPIGCVLLRVVRQLCLSTPDGREALEEFVQDNPGHGYARLLR